MKITVLLLGMLLVCCTACSKSKAATMRTCAECHCKDCKCTEGSGCGCCEGKKCTCSEKNGCKCQ